MAYTESTFEALISLKMTSKWNRPLALSLTLMDSWSWNQALTFASGRPLPGLQYSNQIVIMPLKIPPQPVAVRVDMQNSSEPNISSSCWVRESEYGILILWICYFVDSCMTVDNGWPIFIFLGLAINWSNFLEASLSALDTVKNSKTQNLFYEVHHVMRGDRDKIIALTIHKDLISETQVLTSHCHCLV